MDHAEAGEITARDQDAGSDELAEWTAEGDLESKHRTLWGDAVRRFRRNRLALASLVVVLAMILMALFADLISPSRYDEIDLSAVHQPPSLRHPLGTDLVGRDYLTRIIYGARTSLAVALLVMGIAFGVGIPLGAFAGLRGGRIDFLIMRLVDVATALPGLLFAIFVMAVLGTGFFNVVLALAVTSWVLACRLVRGQFLALREKDFITSARCIGAGQRRIIFRHMLPNALAPLVVALALGIPGVIFGEAALSYLGMGINDPIPSWGKMVSASLGYVRTYPYLALFPTLMIATAMLSFTFVGDGLRDALDPEMVID
jgi:ABC-type dipeptide/oligopeptide/nickel transport system permease subunit